MRVGEVMEAQGRQASVISAVWYGCHRKGRVALRVSVWTGVVLGLALAVTPWLRRLSPLQMRSEALCAIELKSGRDVVDNALTLSRNAIEAAWIAVVTRPPREPKDPSDARQVLEFVASWLPSLTVVHPTEEFVYFEFTAQDELYRGNLRVADLGAEAMTLSYFPHGGAATSIGLKRGEEFKLLEVSGSSYKARLLGREIVFLRPSMVTEAPTTLTLGEGEDYVGWVHDESGERFHLLFSHSPHAFYYVLDQPANEEHREIAPGVEVGERTGFVYRRVEDDSGGERLLYVASGFEDGVMNTYYDGPGDQVPIHIELRDKLNLAYPSTLWGGGVEQNGVYSNTDVWCRYAIIPAQLVHDPAEVGTSELQAAGSLGMGVAQRCEALTHEWWKTRRWWEDALERVRAEGKQLPVCVVCGEFGQMQFDHQGGRF